MTVRQSLLAVLLWHFRCGSTLGATKNNVLAGDDTVDDGHLVVDGDHVGVVVVAQALAGHQASVEVFKQDPLSVMKRHNAADAERREAREKRRSQQ